MSQRRMTSLDVTDTDAFLDMPQSSQLLYFHLNARADDDGFVANPKRIMKSIGSQPDDLKLLAVKKFVITFQDGVCVLKHWRINNFIRKDIYKETQYLDLKRTLFIRPNGAYTLTDDGRSVPVPKGHFQLDDVNDTLTLRQPRLGKDRLGKVSEDTPQLINFDVFWGLYPKKVEKKKTESKWNKLDLKTQEVIVEDLKKRVLGEKWSKDSGRFIEMPTTYLNGERWNDEIVSPQAVGGKSHRV